MPAFTPQPQSIIALWLVLISRPAEGRRLSWPGCGSLCSSLWGQERLSDSRTAAVLRPIIASSAVLGKLCPTNFTAC